MIAAAPSAAARRAAPQPHPSREPTARLRAGRLWLDAFLVPDRVFFLAFCPCPSCGGPVYHDTGDFRCLHCAQDLVVAALSRAGKITALRLRAQPSPTLVRVAPGQERTMARQISRAESANGLQARVLKRVPYGPDMYAVIETIARSLAVPRADIRVSLVALEQAGLVEHFVHKAGYREGWRRLPRVEGQR